MKSKLVNSVLLIIVITTMISSCTGNSGIATNIPAVTLAVQPTPIDPTHLPDSSGSVEQVCIPPTVAFAYPVDLPPVLPLEKEPLVIPSGKWKSIANLPVPEQGIGKLLIRSNNEIWLTYPVRDGAWQYHADSETWKQYSLIQGTNVVIYDLFLTPKNDLWGIGYEQGNGAEGSGSLFLSRYIPEPDEFQFSQVGGEIFKTYNVTMMKQDQEGVVWMMAQIKGQQFPDLLTEGKPVTLFSLDLATEKVRQFQDFPWPGRFELGPDKSIWTLVDDPEPVLQQFNPTTNEILKYSGFPPTSSGIDKASNVSFLYFDRLNHLWLDDRGWLDLSDPNKPVWNQVIRSSAFLIDRGEANSRYVWIRPSEMYQTIDGMYWFGSFYGLVSLNPENGEWCKFTNGTGPFAEDNNHNLWIGVFGRLYKYTILP